MNCRFRVVNADGIALRVLAASRVLEVLAIATASDIAE
jgi:hypothetical protein